jgi:hypothetical protein
MAAMMSKPGRIQRVVLGVGERARKYDLGFPRVRPVYADGHEAARVARECRLAGALVTGEHIAEIVRIVRSIRAAAPTACIAVLDPCFMEPGNADVMLAAGVSLCATSWLALQQAFGAGLRAKPPRPTTRQPGRRLH